MHPGPHPQYYHFLLAQLLPVCYLVITPWLQVLVAQLLLSGEGDTIFALQSLIGAVGMTAFTYFLPYIFLLAMAADLGPPLSPRRRAWCYCNIGLGLFVMIAGARSSLEDLISSSAGLFAGECRLEYAYSPTSPDDPCFGEPASTGNSSSTGGTALR